MIISGPRRKLEYRKGKIFLPDWSRAPVFLNASARLWGVYHKPLQIRSRHAVELVVTPINPSHWKDVWRLEITTEDRPGNLALIYRIFRESGIEVLFNEGSMHSFARYHSMSFIISLKEYENKCDGSSGDRFHDVLPSVPGLETVIQSAFLNQLVFEKAGEPRFLLKRLNLYRLMAENPSGQTRLTPETGIAIDRRGGFRPDPAFFETLKTLAGGRRKNARIEYTPAVDTDFRCVRILFFPADETGPGHLQFTAHHLTTPNLERVTQIVTEEGGNVIRIQLRPGLPRRPVGQIGRLKVPRVPKAEASPARLDLTIESSFDGGTTKGLLKRIVTAVKKDPDLEQCGVDVVDDARRPRRKNRT